MENRIFNRISNRWLSCMLLLLPALLLWRCWNAPFLSYDDSLHIHNNPLALGHASFAETFTPQADSTYFPVTMLSYRLDARLFGWMDSAFKRDWAPGVRLMTLLYHAGAAWFLWRVLERLGAGRGAAFFVALVFAVHPLACETVCWASERKNALAGLFGFACLWAWLSESAKNEKNKLASWSAIVARYWRLPGTVALFGLAVMSKPSALGLLPLLALLEFRATRENSSLSWLGAFLRLAPLAFLSWVIVQFNLVGHAFTFVEYPGGSLFTALLTDVEVLARYLYNVFAPAQLSIAYYVQPIVSLGDSRLWVYGGLLLSLCALSVWVAANRWRAVLGWFWFVAALSPTLNLISIQQVMQDRFLYLSLPGIMLVGVEVWAGLAARLRLSAVVSLAAAEVYLAALLALGVVRGGVFTDMFSLFNDAVQKQPLAAHGHYGLSIAYLQQEEILQSAGRATEAAACATRKNEEVLAFMDCPDAPRQLMYALMALKAGQYLAEDKHDLPAARRYFKLALNVPTDQFSISIKAQARQCYDETLKQMRPQQEQGGSGPAAGKGKQNL